MDPPYEPALAELVASNKAERKRLSAAAREQCRTLQVNQHFTVDLPPGEPGNTATARNINTLARRQFGRGGYRLDRSSDNCRLTVTRIDRA